MSEFFEILNEIWEHQCPEPHCLPPKAMYDDIPKSAKDYCILARVDIMPLHVFYEEVGIKLEQLYGDRLKGRSLDELYNMFFRKVAYSGYKKAIKTRRPVRDSKMVSTIMAPIGYHRLLLPVINENNVLYVMAFIYPSHDSITDADDWKALVEKTPWLNDG